MPEQRRKSSFVPSAEQIRAQESQNLLITYGILIVLLLILWVLYTGLHGGGYSVLASGKHLISSRILPVIDYNQASLLDHR